ncbi:MAG: hypothetical protein ACRDNZ_14725 [Streptosporangiaceae bacterium]
MQVDENQLPGASAAVPGAGEVARRALHFVQHEAGFAQVFTINRAGFPVGRTMVVVCGDDWVVDLVQRNVHRRIGQVRRNPRMEIVWTGPPRPDSVNDRPHVYDFGLAVPQVVFVRGEAEVMDDDLLVTTYEKQTARQHARGLTRAPHRQPDEVRAELTGLRVHPVQVRAEGFGAGATSYTWPAGDGGAA